MKNGALVSLNLTDIARHFGTLSVFNALNWEARAGSITAIVGPNGAGKTTLFRMIAGVLSPSSGSVSLSFADCDKPIEQNGLGFMPEERSLYKDVSVTTLLHYWAVLRQVDKSKRQNSIEQWLEKCRLKEKAHNKVENLSKGNQQKLQIACCLIHDPNVVLLDEPFSGLDPINQRWAVDLLKSFAERGAIVIISAHQLELIEKVAGKIYFLKDGHLKLISTTSQNNSVCFEYIGQSSNELVKNEFIKKLGGDRFEVVVGDSIDNRLYELIGRIALDTDFRILNDGNTIIDRYISMTNGKNS